MSTLPPRAELDLEIEIADLECRMAALDADDHYLEEREAVMRETLSTLKGSLAVMRHRRLSQSHKGDA